jgi:hypothetical protein
MAEDTTVQPEEAAAPAETPAVDSEAIRQMVEAEAQRIVDERIPGLQSAYEKQLAQLRKKLESKDDPSSGYDSFEANEYQKQLEQAQREAAMLRAGRQFPNAFPAYEAIMAADSAEEQMELLESFLSPKKQEATEQAPPQAPAAPEAPPVDPNNPPTTPLPPADGPSNVDDAMRIIDMVGPQWPEFR